MMLWSVTQTSGTSQHNYLMKKKNIVVVVVFILSNFDFSDPPLNLATKNFTLKKKV